jgi:hypothetical protein
MSQLDTTLKRIKVELGVYYQTRQDAKTARIRLIDVAVNLGLDQQQAYKIDVSDWLLGYLAASGVESSYKENHENNNSCKSTCS